MVDNLFGFSCYLCWNSQSILRRFDTFFGFRCVCGWVLEKLIDFGCFCWKASTLSFTSCCFVVVLLFLFIVLTLLYFVLQCL